MRSHCVVGVGPGDPRVLVDPADRVGEVEGRPRTGRSLPVIGAALAGCGVADSGMWPSPANSPDVGSRPTQPAPGMIDLGPGVQVGEVLGRARRPSSGSTSGGELHEVAGDEPGGEAELAQHRDEQPGRVAAGAERAAAGSRPGSGRPAPSGRCRRRRRARAWLSATRKSTMRRAAGGHAAREPVRPGCRPRRSSVDRPEVGLEVGGAAPAS